MGLAFGLQVKLYGRNAEVLVWQHDNVRGHLESSNPLLCSGRKQPSTESPSTQKVYCKSDRCIFSERDSQQAA